MKWVEKDSDFPTSINLSSMVMKIVENTNMMKTGKKKKKMKKELLKLENQSKIRHCSRLDTTKGKRSELKHKAIKCKNEAHKVKKKKPKAKTCGDLWNGIKQSTWSYMKTWRKSRQSRKINSRTNGWTFFKFDEKCKPRDPRNSANPKQNK